MRSFVACSFQWLSRLMLGVVLVGSLVGSGGCSQKARTARHLERAEKFFQDAKYQEAVIEYKNVLKAVPDHDKAIRQIGLALFELGDMRGALTYLQKAETKNPGDSAVAVKLGTLFLGAGDRVQARKRAKSVLDKTPDNLDALVVWTGSVSSTNELEEAIARLQPLGEKLNHEPRYHLALGILYRAKGDWTTAEEVYRKAQAANPKSWEVTLALGDMYLSKQDPVMAGQVYQLAADQAPAASMARIRLARFRLSTGDTKAAKEILANITKESPNFGPALLTRAEIALSEREYDAATADMTRLLKAEPANAEAFVMLQRLNLAQKNKVDEAIAGFTKVVAAFPKASQARLYLGLAYFQKGEPQKALPEIEQAVALNRDNLEAVRALADLCNRMGNPDAALEAIHGYARRQPLDDTLTWLMAVAHSHRKEYAQAVAACRAYMKLIPGNPRGPYVLGEALLQQGDEKEAKAMFEEALRLAPDFTEAVRQLANLEAGPDKNWKAAIRRIEQQLAQAPTNAGLYHLQGGFQVRLRDWSAAEHSFRKALELQPKNLAACMDLSRVFLATGKDDQALAQVDRALTQQPELTDALMLKAQMLEKQNDLAGAAKLLQQILAAQPDFVPAINNLACLYEKKALNKLDEAYELAKRARRLAPKEPSIADTLGWIAYRKGEYKWALQLLKECADQMKRQPLAFHHLGMCQAAMGDEPSARLNLAKALELDPGFPGAGEATEMLAVLSLSEDLRELTTPEQLDAFLAKHAGNALAHLRGGVCYERLGNVPRAQQAYEKALELNAGLVPALLRLAKLCAGPLYQGERAMTLARQAREKAPDDPNVVDAVAWIAYARGEYKWAKSLLTPLATQHALRPEQQYHLAMLHYVSGETELAANRLTQILRASADFPAAGEARRFLQLVERPELALREATANSEVKPRQVEQLPGLMALADSYTRAGEKAKAQALCEQVVEFYPDFTPAFRRLALLYAGQKALAEPAYKLLSKARVLLPNDPEVGAAIGLAAYEKGNYTWAVQLLQESTIALPTRADIQYTLGMSYHQLKNPKAAKKALQQALALDPKAELAATAQKILSETK